MDRDKFCGPIQLYWSKYDNVFNRWLQTFIGSDEDKILDARMQYILSLIEPLQSSDDRRRVERYVFRGNVGYNVIDDDMDEFWFPRNI